MSEAEIRRDERARVAALLEDHADVFATFAADTRNTVKLIAFMLRLDQEPSEVVAPGSNGTANGRGAPETGKRPKGVEAADTPPKPKTKAKPGLTDKQAHTCDVCGKEFGSSQARGVHRARAHGPGKTAAPEPETPVRDSRITNSEWLLRCEDCDYTCGPEDLKAMRQHCMTVHEGRLPSSVERTPSVA